MDVADGQYVVRVKVKGVSIMDDSDVFPIVSPKPFMTVTNPLLGANWGETRTYTITWTKTGTMGDTVRISLLAQNNAHPERIIVESVPNNGSYSWTVPSDITIGKYYVFIRTHDQPTFFAGSSGYFNIVLVLNPMPKDLKK
jgi:hypothetical protein